jgi:hypothetical protein
VKKISVLKKLFRLSAAVAGFFFFSCFDYGVNEFWGRNDDVNERSTKLTSVAPPSSYIASPAYTCLILTDTHFGAKENAPIEELFTWIAAQNPADKPLFCMILGDIVESGKESQYKDYAKFVDRLAAEGISTYAVAGNHDLYNSGWQYWKKYAAPHTSYYRFKTAKFSWYFLDTANGTLGSSQLYDFISRAKSDPNPKLIFTHYPVYAGGVFYFALSNPRERALVLDACARTNAKFILAGHNHFGGEWDYGVFKEVNLKAFRQMRKIYILSVDESGAGSAALREIGF